MKDESTIRKEIQRIEEYKTKWPCVQEIRRECDIMIQMLKWVLEDE